MRNGPFRPEPEPETEGLSLGAMMDAAAGLDDYLQILVNGRRTLVDGGWSVEAAEQLMLTLVLQGQS